MSKTGMARPTLGYKTQRDAIEALYKEGNDAHAIKAMTGAAINTVHRVISSYRKAYKLPKLVYDYSTRIEPERAEQHHPVWSATDNEKRAAFHARAVRAARAARLAP